ncbi:DUF6993 domain-containing protein [Paenarthrobacter sp. YIM B13468]|uniref:DUF6993 domain-containing protein n=1 Tax=Paenarthrobacter sp. YIM B13468 TaxID=3366295 RepID=UPI00366EC369
MSRGTRVEQSSRESNFQLNGRAAGAFLVLVAALALTACAASSPQPTAGPTSSSPTSLQANAEPSVDPAIVATSTAVETTLKKIVATNPKPDTESVRAALVSAGIPQANVEVSVSRTPTGLDVDALEAAALAGDSCVMGQIRDGGVVMSVLPVLATGKCFVGSVR